MPDHKTAWLCLRESLGDFRVHEWIPFGWLLGLQILFLLCAVNLQTPWGMTVAAWAAVPAGGERLLHYPFFFIALPSLHGMVEWVVYLLPGCVLVPLALLRVSEPSEAVLGGEDRRARLRRAMLPTFVAAGLNILLLQGLQWVGANTIMPRFAEFMPGPPGQFTAWILLVLGAYVISVPFLYVPVWGVQRGATFAGALRGGLLEGLRLLFPTFLIVLLASLPALPFLAPAQLFSQVIVTKMRPEIIPLLLAVCAVITSVANYLIYASAMRMHWARQS